MSSATAPARSGSRHGGRLGSWLARFDSPVTTYYLLVCVTAALVVFGLIMVLSASSVVSIGSGSSAYSIFLKQAGFALVGCLALVVASRLPVGAWRRLAVPVLAVALVLQVLVLLVGDTVNGNQNWLRVGPITVQPSEMMKLGLVLTGALILSAKRRSLHRFSHVLIPYLFPLASLGVVLVILGHDLGTVLVLGAVVAGVLFAAGIPARWFAFAGLPFLVMAAGYVVTSPNRLGRFDVWLGRDTNEFGAARQPIHGRYALADGGWFGLGLGASREKWGLLSEPHNDFIFAIIGEELGLPGTLAVLLLFAGLALACYRLVTRTDDFFIRIATAGIMTWVVVQALINIGAVINLLPVIGVPLPLVSSGGSSLITTMMALGVLMSFARAEPGCADALSARPSALKRSLAVIPSVAARSRRAGR